MTGYNTGLSHEGLEIDPWVSSAVITQIEKRALSDRTGQTWRFVGRHHTEHNARALARS